jgi:hypothetical protein
MIVGIRTPIGTRRGYRRRGMGDVMCPDGSNAPTITDCANAGVWPSAGSGGGNASGPSYVDDVFSLIKQALPSGMLILQEVAAQPGQVIKTPTTLVTGANTNVASIPGLSTVSNTGLWIGAAALVAGLFLFSKKG